MGCLPVTCQVPIIANITLLALWGHPTHCTHAISLKGIAVETQCGEMMYSEVMAVLRWDYDVKRASGWPLATC